MSAVPVNVANLARLLWARKRILAIFVGVTALLAALYAVTREPVYESQAVLAPVKDENLQLSGGVGSLLGQVAGMAGLGSGAASLNETVAVLQSREFALHFMREHDIDRYLFPDQWDAGTQRWKPRSGSSLLGLLTAIGVPVKLDQGGIRSGAGPVAEDAVRGFDRLRSVTVDRRTDFIKLTMRGPTPELARDWTRAMIEELNQSLRAVALSDSHRAVEVLSKKIETEQLQSVRVAASALLEAQLRREVMSESRAEFAVRMLDPPSLAETRFYPRRSRMVLTGAALGLFVGALYVLLAAAWRQSRADVVPGTNVRAGRPHID